LQYYKGFFKNVLKIILDKNKSPRCLAHENADFWGIFVSSKPISKNSVRNQLAD